ncbi:MAG TPA: histidine kinase [Patescibacteria group bacterium]|nr:histidine kinase [Patescibacteria group bacterium]
MRAGLFLVIGVLLGLLVTALLALHGGAAIETSALLGMPLGLLYGAVCLAARYPTHAAPLGRTGLGQIAATHGFGALISSGGLLMAGNVLSQVLEHFPRYRGTTALFHAEAPTLSVTAVLVYLLAVAVHYLVMALESARDAEVRGVESQVLAREAELRALRAQVDPHFLFNSLNSIAALTSEDAGAARRMCLLLAGFMRRSLMLGSRDRIPLGEEIALVSDYLAIEKVRFGARLEVTQDIDDASRDCAVPPLILQPLVENAVRHGIAQLLPGGTVRLDTRLHGDHVIITVANPRDHERAGSRGAGVGIENVRGRLRTLYGDRAGMEVEGDESSYRVTLRLPIERVAAAAKEVPHVARG